MPTEPNMTDEKTERLREAQQKLREAGKSTRAAGKDRALQALTWIYRWGWSSPGVIDALGGAARRGLCKKLEEAGLVQTVKTKSGQILADIPSKIVTLTAQGLEEVERTIDDMIDYTIDPYRVNQNTLRHDMSVQRATLKNLRAGTITGFSTPAELSSKSQPGIKQPDAIWFLKGERRLAVELELSAKFDRKLDDFVDKILTSISEKRFDRVAIISDSQAILRRYKAAFEPGHEVRVWQKDERGRWRIENRYEVPDWIKGAMLWLPIEK
jgi:hypothetical protein